MGGAFTIPDKLNLFGVVTMATDALDIGWSFIREELVLSLGEPVMAAAEKGFDLVVTLVNEGPMGVWEDLKAEVGDLKDLAIDAIKEWALTQIVKKASIKLLSMLNPAGAIVQAILLIYDTVMFFVENWDRIVAFVNSIFDSISNIAAGNIGEAANFIEKNLGLALTMLVSFLARFIGLGGIAKKIQKVLKTFSMKIKKGIRKVLKKVTGKIKGWFGGSKGGKKEDKGKKDKEADAKVKKGDMVEWWNDKAKVDAADGETHKLYYKGEGKNAELWMASEHMSLEDHIKDARKDAKEAKDKTQLTDLDKVDKCHAEIREIEDKAVLAQNKADSERDPAKRKALLAKVETWDTKHNALFLKVRKCVRLGKWEKQGDADLKVGKHQIKGGDKNKNKRESHHVPANELRSVIGKLYTQTGEQLQGEGMEHFDDLSAQLRSKGKAIKEKFPSGAHLSAILLHEDTHFSATRGVHSNDLQVPILEDHIEEAARTEEERMILFADGTRLAGNPKSGQWGKLLEVLRNHAAQAEDTNTVEKITLNSVDDNNLVIKIEGSNSEATQQVSKELKQTAEKDMSRAGDGPRGAREAKKKIIQRLESLAGEAYEIGLKNGIRSVKVALQKSQDAGTDGNPDAHAKALKDVAVLADQIWEPTILKI